VNFKLGGGEISSGLQAGRGGVMRREGPRRRGKRRPLRKKGGCRVFRRARAEGEGTRSIGATARPSARGLPGGGSVQGEFHGLAGLKSFSFIVRLKWLKAGPADNREGLKKATSSLKLFGWKGV